MTPPATGPTHNLTPTVTGHAGINAGALIPLRGGDPSNTVATLEIPVGANFAVSRNNFLLVGARGALSLNSDPAGLLTGTVGYARYLGTGQFLSLRVHAGSVLGNFGLAGPNSDSEYSPVVSGEATWTNGLPIPHPALIWLTGATISVEAGHIIDDDITYALIKFGWTAPDIREFFKFLSDL